MELMISVQPYRYLCDYKVMVMFLIINFLLLSFIIKNKKRLLSLIIAMATMVMKMIYIETMKSNKKEYGYFELYQYSNIIVPLTLVVNIIILIYLIRFIISKIKYLRKRN